MFVKCMQLHLTERNGTTRHNVLNLMKNLLFSIKISYGGITAHRKLAALRALIRKNFFQKKMN